MVSLLGEIQGKIEEEGKAAALLFCWFPPSSCSRFSCIRISVFLFVSLGFCVQFSWLPTVSGACDLWQVWHGA